MHDVHTLAELEERMRSVFSIPETKECRVWHRYMTSIYELHSNTSQTLQEAGLYNGQVSSYSCCCDM